MPTKRPRMTIQFETDELKIACEKYVEDKGIKSMSTLVNELLTDLMVKHKYYRPPQPPKALK